MKFNGHNGIAPLHTPPAVIDCDNLPNDMHKLQILRQLHRVTTVQMPTEPADMALEVPSRPAWQAPTRRHLPGRWTAPGYRRTHPVVRLVCRMLPFLAPVARRVF